MQESLPTMQAHVSSGVRSGLALGLLLALIASSNLSSARALGPMRPRASFDADGRADLAVGVPYESVGAIGAAGGVHVVYGSIYGLTTVDDQLWHQDIPGVEGMVESSDQFGYALAALYRVKNDRVYLPLLLKSYGL